MKKYNRIFKIVLIIIAVSGLYFVSTDHTNQYLKSLGYLMIGSSSFVITYLKKKELKENM